MSESTSENKAAGQQWREGYDRVSALATQAGDDKMSVTVPACPDWTARDLLSHMIGVGVDSLAGTAPDDNNPGWTNGHVEYRRASSTEDLLAEWAQQADAIETFVAETNPGPMGDLLIHEQDLRGALGVPGAQETDGLAMVREMFLGMLADGVESSDADAPLRLEATDTDWSWSSGDGEPGAVVSAPLFDLTRATMARRTAEQLGGWTTSGSIEPYLEAFATVGPLPEEALPE